MEKEKILTAEEIAEEIIEDANEEAVKGKPIGKIKKEDRAFLYFRENGLGNLNIKFGPEKYVHNTEKFYEILMYGLFKGVSFLSGLTKKHPLEKRREHYETISTSLSAVVNESFPDVFDEIKREIELENETIKRVEAGHEVSEEFQEKFDEAKEQLKSRVVKRENLTVSETNKQLSKDLEGQIELFKDTQDAIVFKFYGDKGHEGLEEDNEDFSPSKIVFNLIQSKIYDLSKQLQACYISEEEQN